MKAISSAAPTPASSSVDRASAGGTYPTSCGEEGGDVSGGPSLGGSEGLCGHSLSEWSFLGRVALGQPLSLSWPPFLPLIENRLAKGTLRSSWSKDFQQEPCWDQWPCGEDLIVALGRET